MSKSRAFQGQNDAPAPPQGSEQIGVYDRPAHKSVATPKTASLSGSGPTGDPRDMHAKAPRTIAAGAGNHKQYQGELSQEGENHGEGFKSGINAAEKPAKK